MILMVIASRKKEREENLLIESLIDESEHILQMMIPSLHHSSVPPGSCACTRYWFTKILGTNIWTSPVLHHVRILSRYHVRCVHLPLFTVNGSVTLSDSSDVSFTGKTS